MNIALAPVDRIIRKAGAERVSEDAARELARLLEEYGEEVAREAWNLARHAGRKTVHAEDIRLAAQRR